MDDLQDRSQKFDAVDGVATGTTGTKHSYTVPTGKTATVTALSFSSDGAPTIVIEVVRGGNTYQIGGSFSAGIRENVRGLQLEAGDLIRFRCTVGAALSVSDFSFSLVEKSK